MTALTLPSAAATDRKPPAGARTRLAWNRGRLDLPPRSMPRLNARMPTMRASSCAQAVQRAFRLHNAPVGAGEGSRHLLPHDAARQVSPGRRFL